ncbi:unnamed protein product [Parascedosporium putredinis]|uniref:Uncharacterized protein n=1 Tax=Parascedosporium putredinis TaxID=1442378 RepID=A0A9P1GZP7_9PEZI|nr:unnamed protein product [Parascedosporium putredinis]CAI7991969.1 unnamed protein product [Parascedosporium putredinis]
MSQQTTFHPKTITISMTIGGVVVTIQLGVDSGPGGYPEAQGGFAMPDSFIIPEEVADTIMPEATSGHPPGEEVSNEEFLQQVGFLPPNP